MKNKKSAPVALDDTKKYYLAYQTFKQLMERANADVISEYEACVDIVINRYNTTILENRFIVGGVVEVLTALLIASADAEVNLAGEGRPGIDIVLRDGSGMSCKGTFTEKVSEIALINKRGSGSRTWEEPTLIIRSGSGIAFIAPDMIDVEQWIQDKNDQIVLHKNVIEAICQDERFLFPIAIPYKPKTGIRRSVGASRMMAHAILKEANAGNLLDKISQIGGM